MTVLLWKTVLLGPDQSVTLIKNKINKHLFYFRNKETYYVWV